MILLRIFVLTLMLQPISPQDQLTASYGRQFSQFYLRLNLKVHQYLSLTFYSIKNLSGNFE
jgi:hypothetical protein